MSRCEQRVHHIPLHGTHSAAKSPGGVLEGSPGYMLFRRSRGHSWAFQQWCSFVSHLLLIPSRTSVQKSRRAKRHRSCHRSSWQAWIYVVGWLLLACEARRVSLFNAWRSRPTGAVEFVATPSSFVSRLFSRDVSACDIRRFNKSEVNRATTGAAANLESIML